MAKKQRGNENVVGIDVSAKTLQVALKGVDGQVTEMEFPNTPTGHKNLVEKLTKKGRSARVSLEATGTYSLDVAIELTSHPRIAVMVVNPKSARKFAEAQMRRAKTDRVDALSLLEYAQRMEFVPWQRPDSARLQLRTIARRVTALKEEQVSEKNRLMAAQATLETPRVVLDDLALGIQQIEARIEQLERQALELLQQSPELREAHRVITSINGIADRSAIRILGELLLLAPDMSPREVVAQAGLDPRPRQSGARDGQRRISKVGNAYLRAALFMPAVAAARSNPAVAAFHQRLTGRGKLPMVSIVAIMRKLLSSIWMMLKKGETFRPELFSKVEAKNAAAA